MTRYQALLQPFRLKHLHLRNRIMSTSHEPAYAEDGRPGLRYRLYHEEKAKGGIALTMIGGSAVVAPELAAGVRQPASVRRAHRRRSRRRSRGPCTRTAPR